MKKEKFCSLSSSFNIIFLLIIINNLIQHCNCTVIKNNQQKKNLSDDVLIIEPELFSNSTESVLIEKQEDIYYNEDEPVKYFGAQLWRIPYENQEKRNVVAELQENFDVVMWNLNQNSTSVDILIKQQVLTGAKILLDDAKIPFNILIDDLQQSIDNENPPKEIIEELQNRKARKTNYWQNSAQRVYSPSSLIHPKFYKRRLKGALLGYNSLDIPLELWPHANWGHRLTWIAYHRLGDIYSFLDDLAKTHSDICSVQTIGMSVQDRPLKVLRISNGRRSNKAIWIDGGIHAREWISPASVTYMINHFVLDWEAQPDYIRNIDWYILAVANPDGYEYSHQVDRLWRKNRGGTGSGRCAGVDLNRNFGYLWGGQGASRQPCAETFAGSGAFSEPETRAIRDFMGNSAADFKAFLTFHSYGQYILYPWGYDRTVPPDWMDLDRVAKEAAAKIKESSGSVYTTGPSGSLLYPAAGASDDWAKGSLGIKFAYTIELRDSGRYGFILPASQIESTANEALEYVNVVAKAVHVLK